MTDVAGLASGQRMVLAWVCGINVATFAGMVAASALSGSSPLLTDALDHLGDALTYALSIAVVGAPRPRPSRPVAMLKGLLILGAALAVAAQIGWRLTDLDAPVASTMPVACLLTPHRTGDVNMSSSWECSRNDVIEGVASSLRPLPCRCSTPVGRTSWWR